ncbi:peptidylprolyl isomerase [Flavobacteriaceae bacterium]|nr:peptidylprolyl isomerase [Flavobacteriaceae bacterium]MDA8947712.1 peptidylprolyl isomerase [Flavobacteriaceae bacterium]MDA9572094.1 peptidylprolyl isomerase [Flavobacteriaceae bacterium]MDC3354014.1 peptidylprolyl isomerase [Flavobacteriaceae bacterium]
MAVLGKIRQQSIILILVIGMALFAFVISGVFDGNSASNGPTDPIALVNEEEIDVTFFRQMVEQTERAYNYSTLQSVNLVWNQALRNTIFEQEYEKLGIDAGKDQLEQIISSDDAVVNNPSFQNEAGFFDFGIFTDYIAQMRIQEPAAYENWKAQEKSITGVAKQRIYLDLIKSSGGMTETEAKALYHFENDNINIEYVQIPFDVIPDSLVSVTDAEIKRYINDHEMDYERDSSRNLQFVSFDESPTQDDLDRIRLRLEVLKDERIAYNDVSKLTDTIEGFKNTKNIIDFVDQYSEIPFDSVYRPRGQFNNEYADILFGLEVGEVFGPYRDSNYFKISRLLDRKENASLRASHILIAFEGATRAEEITRSKEEAKREANRVFRLARRGNDNFEELAREYSDGPTKNRGGDLGFFQEGQMAQEFFNYVNKNKVGRIGLVETEFGFHIIKVTDKDDLAMIADVAIEAIASDETANEVFRKATKFEMESNDTKDFLATAEKYNYQVRPVRQISVLEENMPGLYNQRQIVRWGFEDDTKVGDIRRFSLTGGGGYAVVQLTAINKKGLASIDEVGAQVRNIITQNKKAALIKKQYESINSLEALAEDEDLTIETASAINQKNPTLVGAGNEPYVVGAAFVMEEGTLSGLIQGERGIYKVKLLKKNEAEPLEDYNEFSKEYLRQASFTLLENVFLALESNANIEDNRALYY